MKKLFYVLLFLLLLFCSFFFFKKNDDQNTVVFWTLQLSSFEKYINNIISEFEKENPKVKIQWIDVPYSEGEKRTLAAILTDNPPDLINLTPDFSLLLAQKNALYSISEDKMSAFLPSLVEMLKYNDNYFGIPFYATSAVTLFNSFLFNDKIPKTYDDLFEIIPMNGIYSTMINFTENDTLLKLLNKYNINSPETINSDEAVSFFKKIKKLYDKDYIPKESVTQTHRDSLEKYMSGKLIFLVTGANFINMIKENAPSVYHNTKVLPQLVGKSGKYDYSLMNFVIPKKSKNHEAALKFALFFTNKRNQLEFAKMTTILPVNKDALNDDYFMLAKKGDIQAEARIISAKQLNNIQPPLKNIKNKKELNTLSSNYVQEILINNASIKETLDIFAQNWEKL